MPVHRLATGIPVDVRADIMRLSKASLAEILWDVLAEYQGEQGSNVELVEDIYRRERLLDQIR